jgi:hypothetical protein
MIICFIFDWDSFWINIIAGLIFFILGIFVSIRLVPKYTVRLIRKKNIKYSIIKIGAVLQEFCDFINQSPFKDKILDFEQIAVFTKKFDSKGRISLDYRFISLCSINVFNKIIYPQMILVVYGYFKDKDPNEQYNLITSEYKRLKDFRLEIERILSVHSLHIDDIIIQKISNLCIDIKALETRFKDNIIYDGLLKSTGSEREGIFGLNELPKIYESLLYLIEELISLEYFEYEIKKAD